MSSELTRRLGLRMRQLRNAHGISQRQLAIAAGLKEETVSRVERGVRGLKVDSLAAVAAVLGLDLGGILVPRGNTLPVVRCPSGMYAVPMSTEEVPRA